MMTIKQFLLLKTMEECDEVSQRASKQMQFGRDEAQGTGVHGEDATIYPTNSQRLRGEVNDLLSMIRMLEFLGELSEASDVELACAYAAKYAKIAKYLKYSQDLGNVESGSITLLAPRTGIPPQ